MSEQAYIRSTKPEEAQEQFGLKINYLVEHDDSAGRLCLVHYQSKPGHEPPPHTHIDEDEIYYVLEGELDVYVGDTVQRAGAGDCIFLPRGQAHAWLIRSAVLRTLILTQPANTDRMFRASGDLAHAAKPPVDSYAEALRQGMGDKLIGIAEQFGLHVLSPKETRQQLPQYPLPA